MIRATDIGARVREAREAADLTQTALAKRTGSTQPTISRLESGRPDTPTPTTDTLVRLAGALGVSVDWLLGLEVSDRSADPR